MITEKIENAMYKIWKENNKEENVEFKKLERVKKEIETTVDYLKKEIFNKINSNLQKDRREAARILKENIQLEEFEKIIYVTFTIKKDLLEDGRLSDIVKENIIKIIDKYNENTSSIIWFDYYCYEHPTLWNNLIYEVYKK